MESPLRAPEEIFAVLIFVAPVRTGRRGAIDIALTAISAVYIFTEADLFAKTTKFCTMRKFPRYTVLVASQKTQVHVWVMVKSSTYPRKVHCMAHMCCVQVYMCGGVAGHLNSYRQVGQGPVGIEHVHSYYCSVYCM